jgi:transposase
MILPPEIRDLIGALQSEIEALRADNAALRQEVTDLRRQLDKNSSNSSKPPSSDGLKKPPRVAGSTRGKSGKASGGQAGHAGGTLKQVAKPDVIERHEAEACRHCLAGLMTAMVTGVEKRQVFDLPEPRLEVTEHQAMIYRCAHCRGQTTASFPDGVSSSAQYGPRVRAVSVYLNVQQLIPEDRFARTASSHASLRHERGDLRRDSPEFLGLPFAPGAISTKPAFASPARANGCIPPRPSP